MANIFKPKYGEGHKVVIKDKIGLNKVRNDIGALVSKSVYVISPGKTVFELVKTKARQKNPKHIVYLSKDKSGESMFMKKLGSSLLYEFRGAKSVIQGMFDHAGDGKSSKSETNIKTECKEVVSLILMEGKLKNNKNLSYDEVESMLPRKLKTFFHEDYFISAQKQIKAWLSKESGRFKGAGYIYERQLDNVTNKIYKNALQLSKLNKDNWNPGDIWIVKKNADLSKYEKASNIKQINKMLVEDYNNQNCVGISLKQVNPNQNARINYINLSATKKSEAKFDFGFNQCDFTGDTFKNAIIYTKSGFGVRMGLKVDLVFVWDLKHLLKTLEYI